MDDNKNEASTGSELNSLDALRQSIEQEKRFQSAMFGYEKKSVQNYLDQMNASFRKAIDELETECDRLRRENGDLFGRLKEQEEATAEARAEERLRNETELNVRESIVSNLRATNQRLSEENRRFMAEISDLHTQLAQTKDNVTDSNQVMSTLNKKLTSMLQEKIKECDEIVTAWQNEFNDAVDTVDAQVRLYS